MKKYLVHLIYIMIITFLVIFSQIKVAEADNNKQEAIWAINNAKEAQEQSEKVSAQAQEQVNMESQRALKLQTKIENITRELKACQRK